MADESEVNDNIGGLPNGGQPEPNDAPTKELVSELKDAIDAAVKRDSIRYSVLHDKNMAPGERKALNAADAATSFLKGGNVTSDGIKAQLSNIASVDASEDARFTKITGGSTQNLKLNDTNGKPMVYSELKHSVNPLNIASGSVADKPFGPEKPVDRALAPT